jgi:hypothetical protein
MSVADAWARLNQVAERYVRHAMVVAAQRGNAAVTNRRGGDASNVLALIAFFVDMARAR